MVPRWWFYWSCFSLSAAEIESKKDLEYVVPTLSMVCGRARIIIVPARISSLNLGHFRASIKNKPVPTTAPPNVFSSALFSSSFSGLRMMRSRRWFRLMRSREGFHIVGSCVSSVCNEGASARLWVRRPPVPVASSESRKSMCAVAWDTT
jgi:hypothetical protein